MNMKKLKWRYNSEYCQWFSGDKIRIWAMTKAGKNNNYLLQIDGVLKAGGIFFKKLSTAKKVAQLIFNG